jgi:hypothetical protein
VCEREIHLPEAVRYAQAAGFTACRLVPHFVPSLTLDPADLPRMATAPSDTWRLLRDDGSPTAFDEFLVQSLYCHPVLACAKGERPLDSRQPRQLKARIAPDLTREGTHVRGRVVVQNEGDTRWIRGEQEAGAVRLGIQLMTPDRRLLQLDFARAILPHDVPAGGEAEVAIDLALPDAAGYLLKLDLVDEQICWFEDVGSRPVYVAV